MIEPSKGVERPQHQYLRWTGFGVVASGALRNVAVPSRWS
jgi:hypothetical protein